MNNESIAISKAKSDLEEILRLSQKLESIRGIDTKLLREPIDEARRLGLNEIRIAELCAPIDGYLYCIFHPSRSHPEWNMDIAETSYADVLRLNREVRDRMIFLVSLEENDINILNYLVPFVIISSKRKEKKKSYHQEISLEVDDLFYRLNKDKRSIVRDFIKHMFENNYKVARYEYDSDNRNFDSKYRISPLDALILYLSEDRTILQKKIRKDLFKALTDKRIKFSSGKIFGGLSIESRINELIENQIELLKENYPDRERVIECLNTAFCSFNLRLYNKCMSESILFKSDFDKIKEEMQSIATTLKEGKGTDEFYDFLRSFLSTEWIEHYSSSYKKHLSKLRNNTNGKLLQDFYDYATRKTKYLNELSRYLEILSHNEVKSLEELKELISLSVKDYLPISVIGEGKSRRVYKVVYEPRGQVLALKLNIPEEHITDPRTKKGFKSHSQTEISALMDLTHANLARMWDFSVYSNPNFSTRRNYIVEEYVDGETLENLIKEKGPLNHEEFILVFGPILRAIRYLEEKKYIHRDIKPDNILVSNKSGMVKLTDLQTTVRADESGQYLGESFGAIRTMAPELILENRASFSSDLYSIGTCMYYAIIGEMPFEYGEFKDMEELRPRVRELQNNKEQRRRIEKDIDEYIREFFGKTLLSPQNPNAMNVIDEIPKLLSFDPELRTRRIGFLFEEFDRLYNHVSGHPINY